MKRTIFCFPVVMILIFIFFCTLMPYPILSNTTNLNKSQNFQINTINETELKNISETKFNVLDESWNKCIDFVLSYYTPYEIIDLNSEQSFFLTRIGGKNHADMIATTKEDEFFISNHYNGKQYAPVAVKLNEQTYIPACFCPYAHGYQNHYCLHFKNSKTDGTQKKDNIYQNVVNHSKQKLIKIINNS